MQNSSKWICNGIITLIVLAGVVIALFYPTHSDSFNVVCNSLTILLGGWMAVIFGGNVSKLHFTHKGKIFDKSVSAVTLDDKVGVSKK